jgi:hypothetical protein
MASNDNGKRKFVEEVESSMVRKRLQLSNNDGGDDDSSNSPEEETEEEEVSLDESSMKLDTSKEKLLDKCGHGQSFSDNNDTTSPSLVPHTLKSCRCSDEDSSDEDDDL